MRIAIDAHALGTNSAGNEVYIENLIRNLSVIDQKNEYVIYLKSPVMLSLPLNYRISALNTQNRLARALSLTRLINKDRPSIYHSQYFLPPFQNYPGVITIHDVAVLSHPEWFTPLERLIFKALSNSVKKARRIICVSEFTKNEIKKYFPYADNKITVIYNGIDKNFRPDLDSSTTLKIKSRYSLPDRYMLFVGRFNNRKNIPLLLEAFTSFRKEHKDNFKLVLIGKEHGKSLDLKEIISKLRIQDEVKFIGYLPYSDLPAIYKSAALFVFPSFYEGFGLPPLEAMACGTPVITSDAPIFTETLGNAAVRVNPHDPGELTKTMEQLVSDESFRKEMVLKGLAMAKRYDWQETARQTLKVYEETLQ